MVKKFQDIKRVIGIRKSKKDRQHNGKKKKIKLRYTKHYIKIQHRPTHDKWCPFLRWSLCFHEAQLQFVRNRKQ